MKKIKCEVGENTPGIMLSFTDCPEGFKQKVGSVMCQRREYHTSQDKDKLVVICNFPNKGFKIDFKNSSN